MPQVTSAVEAERTINSAQEKNNIFFFQNAENKFSPFGEDWTHQQGLSEMFYLYAVWRNWHGSRADVSWLPIKNSIWFCETVNTFESIHFTLYRSAVTVTVQILLKLIYVSCPTIFKGPIPLTCHALNSA